MEFTAWLRYGGGQELKDRIYGENDMISLQCLIIAPETSGWFRKKYTRVEELKGMKRVLRRLGMLNSDNVVEAKGRVACEVDSADELVITELIFNNSFSGMTVEQLVALCSCFVYGERASDEAGKGLDMTPSGIRVNGRRSTPGRYFQVADPGTGWGGTDVEDPLTILRDADPKRAWPGLRLLMISTTGEQWAYFTLDDDLIPQPAKITPELLVVADRIAENCEPSLCSVLFMGGAGGSLRAGVTENPVRLTRSVKESLTHVSCGGAEAYVWPGGGITVMVDVMDMPTNSFGYVPTPALVAPIEFTLRREDYGTLGGHMEHIQPVRDVVTDDVRRVAQQLLQPDPNARENYGWSKDET